MIRLVWNSSVSNGDDQIPVDTGRRAPFQGTERVEIDRCRSFRLQVGVEQREMRELVIRVVVNVLGEVTVQVR